MEIGNMMFGNSRGEYHVERGIGFEEELCRLFQAYAPQRDNSWREYGEAYENDTFFVFPYYWGDCTCGYEQLEWEWGKTHSHSSGCYQTEYRALSDDEKYSWRKSDKAVKALCRKHGIPWNGGRGCAVHCTCSYDKEWELWVAENHHAAQCPIIRPNFCYKPKDFQLKWYKYPLRDSYMNQAIDLVDFRSIIDSCIASVTTIR